LLRFDLNEQFLFELFDAVKQSLQFVLQISLSTDGAHTRNDRRDVSAAAK
jgi:hypothetical protein